MVQSAWLQGQIKVVCATIAYGMFCFVFLLNIDRLFYDEMIDV